MTLTDQRRHESNGMLISLGLITIAVVALLVSSTRDLNPDHDHGTAPCQTQGAP